MDWELDAELHDTRFFFFLALSLCLLFQTHSSIAVCVLLRWKTPRCVYCVHLYRPIQTKYTQIYIVYNIRVLNELIMFLCMFLSFSHFPISFIVPKWTAWFLCQRSYTLFCLCDMCVVVFSLLFCQGDKYVKTIDTSNVLTNRYIVSNWVKCGR